MKYIEYEQYENRGRDPYRPPLPHPNGLIGDQFTADLIAGHIADLIAGHIADNDDEADWISRIRNLRIVRLNGSTKEPSKHRKRKARQACYLAIGEIQSVQDYAERVAALPTTPTNLQVTNHSVVAYEDLWWDCQGGHCKGRKGVIGKPYIKFLPPDEPAS